MRLITAFQITKRLPVSQNWDLQCLTCSNNDFFTCCNLQIITPQHINHIQQHWTLHCLQSTWWSLQSCSYRMPVSGPGFLIVRWLLACNKSHDVDLSMDTTRKCLHCVISPSATVFVVTTTVGVMLSIRNLLDCDHFCSLCSYAQITVKVDCCIFILSQLQLSQCPIPIH